MHLKRLMEVKKNHIELANFLQSLWDNFELYFKYLQWDEEESSSYLPIFGTATLLSPLHSFCLDEKEVFIAKTHLKELYMERFGEELKKQEENVSADLLGLEEEFPFLNDQLLKDHDTEQASCSFETDYEEYRNQAKLEVSRLKQDKSRSRCPIEFWKKKDTRFSKIATSVLSVYPTSTSVERLFSISSQLCNLRRNKILPEHLEQRILLKLNKDLIAP